MSRLTIMLLTYERLRYAEDTLRAALDNIKFSGEIAVHIADDGSREGHISALRELAGGYSHIVSVGCSNSERGGYGRNYNLATQQIHPASDFVLPLEDDWRLVRPLEMDPLAEVLQIAGSIGCIRLGYLGFTDLLLGFIQRWCGQSFFVMDEHSPEKHVFAGHPRLETTDWQKHMGPWPEGLSPGDTELAVCSFVRRGIAWPIDLVHSNGDLFHHIGSERSY